MKAAIANAAFLINLAGLVLTGYLADVAAPVIICFMAAWFAIGTYTAGLWVFGARK